MPTKEEIRKFSEMIDIMATDKKLSIMDAICHHCKVTGLEIEVAATLCNVVIKAKIKEEAESLNMMKKSSRLPI